jgi:hypothetical protein
LATKPLFRRWQKKRKMDDEDVREMDVVDELEETIETLRNHTI